MCLHLIHYFVFPFWKAVLSLCKQTGILPWAWLLSGEKEGEQSAPRVPLGNYVEWALEAEEPPEAGFAVEGLLTAWKQEQRGQALCCSSGRCGTESAAPGDAEQRWLQALCAAWLLSLTRAAEAPDTHSIRHRLLWLKVGLPEMPSFPGCRFGASIRSFTLTITSCPLHQDTVTTGSVILA